MADNGAHPTEEDPAAAFLAQQESEIAGIENDNDGFGALEEADSLQASHPQTVNYGKFMTKLMLKSASIQAYNLVYWAIIAVIFYYLVLKSHILVHSK